VKKSSLPEKLENYYYHTVLQPLYRTTYISQHSVKNWSILLQQSFSDGN